jgi:O-antigen ligase
LEARGLNFAAIAALLAFGGVYLPAAAALALFAAVACAAIRPTIGRADARALDIALVSCVIAGSIQLVPLPPWVVGFISLASLRLGRELPLGPQPASATFSIHPSDTVHALLVLVTSVAVFWCAREAFKAGGVRTSGRMIAFAGFAVSLVAIAQSATARGSIYWRWRPTFEGPDPFGPFVNRNHFATWAALAIPLCLGYLAARSRGRGADSVMRPLGSRIASALDGRTLFLTAATVALGAALTLTLSRSGIAALAAALGAGWWLTSPRQVGAGRRWSVAAALGLAGAALIWNAPALASRFGRASVGYADRLVIWRETLPIVRDFWATGSGLGTFESAMAFYQRADRSVFFNQAHSEYLQLAAEGGLLVAVPAVAAALAFVRLAVVRLRGDQTGMFWMRAGAATGLTAAALQSVWENGLRIPANALLAAILAAIVIHEPHSSSHPHR